jgi:hypothetical protein
MSESTTTTTMLYSTNFSEATDDNGTPICCYCTGSAGLHQACRLDIYTSQEKLTGSGNVCGKYASIIYKKNLEAQGTCDDGVDVDGHVCLYHQHIHKCDGCLVGDMWKAQSYRNLHHPLKFLLERFV